MRFIVTYILISTIVALVNSEYALVTVSLSINSELSCVFVHGHRGHFSQANSLKEVLTNYCDLYSADLLEDVSGLSHSVVYWQADYLEKAIKSLWEKNNKKIVLVCHSMGAVSGIIAGNRVLEVIEKILTLNSPLGHSPVNTYAAFPVMYSKLHRIMESGMISIVSVTGADDYTVPARLTKVPELKNQHFYTVSLVGEQLDHNEILYSQKLLRKIPEMLGKKFYFELIGWTNDENSRIEALGDCLISENAESLHMGAKKIEDKGWFSLKFDKDSVIVIKTNILLEQVCRGIRTLNPVHLQVNDFHYYKLPVFDEDQYFFLLSPGEYEINRVKNEKCLRIYYKFCKLSANGPVSVKVGSLLRSPLLFESDKKVHWVYSKCGDEEYFVQNTEKLLVKFHEYCEKVEVWVYSENTRFILSTPLNEIIVQVLKEFRLEIISFIIALVFNSTWMTVCWFILYWSIGKYCRYFGLYFIEHLDYVDKRVSLFECTLLAIVSIPTAKLLNIILEYQSKLKKTQPILPNNHKKWPIFFIFLQPWAGLYLTISTNLRPFNLLERKFFFAYTLLTLPQQFFFFWSIFYYRSIPLPNIYDFFTVLPVSLFFIVPSKPLNLYSPSMSFIFILFVQDLLYRGQIYLSVVIVYHLVYPLKSRLIKTS